MNSMVLTWLNKGYNKNNNTVLCCVYALHYCCGSQHRSLLTFPYSFFKNMHSDKYIMMISTGDHNKVKNKFSSAVNDLIVAQEAITDQSE